MEYQRQIRLYGHATYCSITRAVGLKSNSGSYAAKVIHAWKAMQNPPSLKGKIRECLCCDRPFTSSGKHNRMCDNCRPYGEYHQPYPISPSIGYAGDY